MRHRVAGKKLGRKTEHRTALFKNMVTALFEHDRIITTDTKARALRPIAEKLITKAKTNDIHHRRLVFLMVRNETVIKRLFDVIAPRYATRNGGYSRIIKMGRRPGDAAQKAMLELVDAPEKVKKVVTSEKGKKADASEKGKKEVKSSGKQAAESKQK